MSEGWHNAVTAARKLGKPLYFVEHIGGGIVEATTSREAAIKYRAEQSRPHLYRVYEQSPHGALYLVAT